MAGGYTVGIASETKAFKQGIESGVIDPLEDAQKELLELGKSRGPEQLERALKDAEKATERLQDETKDTARAIEQEFRDSYRSVKRSSDDGMDGAKEGMQDFKEEANQTARESAASFDGSAESIVDVFQELAANAFGGFGPAGAVAGLAAAAGIGLAMAGFQDVQEAQEESKQRAAEWADAYIEAGSRALTFDQQAALVRSIITDDERYQVAIDNAKLWGVSIDTAVAALAGSESAIDDVTTAIDDKRVASEKDAAAAQAAAEANGSALGALTPLEVEYNKAKDALSLLTGEMDRGAQGADVMSRWMADTARNTAGATEAVDEFGDSIITLPEGKQIYVDAETGQATESVDAIEKKIYGIPDGSSTVTVTADTSQVDREMRRLSNTTLKIGARIVTSGSGWDQ